MRKNIVTNTDSYKLTHHKMYVPGTQRVLSYFESRLGATFNKTVWFGLQYDLIEYLQGKVVTPEGIEWGRELAQAHFGSADIFNEKMWRHILEKKAGMLPLRICSVPEGTPVDVSNVLMTVENTDEECAPLTNHCETLLSNLWAPSTVASLSREVKILLKWYNDQTSDAPGAVNFGLHDFGQRGVTSPESAGIEGAGHIVNFLGTDTVLAMETAHDYYGANLAGLAYSVPASEHSVMTALGPEGEFNIFDNLLTEFRKGILSVVIDSYDYRRFISVYAKKLKDKILTREDICLPDGTVIQPGKTVFRPDSGEPVSTTLEVLDLLDKVFGHTVNSKGYKVLCNRVGVLWGDGIDYHGIRNILHAMKAAGWASDNIVFGMGGGLLQKINRDTQRFAFKSCAQKRNGEWYDVFKKPLDASKASKRGRLKLIREKDGTFHTVGENERPEMFNWLIPVFENGVILKRYTFDEIRANAAL